jgi:hypothetical protein
MYVSVPCGDQSGVQLSTFSFNGHDSHATYTTLMSSRKVWYCWEDPVGNGSLTSWGSMQRSHSFSLLQASNVATAEPSLPLLTSSPQRLTVWWCRFMCILCKIWLLHLRSMCGAPSDPPHKGQVAGPVMWLNILVCLSVCIVSVPYIFENLFLFLRSHIWHGT